MHDAEWMAILIPEMGRCWPHVFLRLSLGIVPEI